MTDLEIYSSYLPYKVKVQTGNSVIKEISGLSFYKTEAYDEIYCDGEYACQLSEAKLILRPLTDLVNGVFPHKLIDFLIKENIYKNSFAKGHEKYHYNIIEKPFGKVIKFTNHDDWVFYLSINEPDRIKHKVYCWFLKNHFDVFNLIDQGKAININKL